MGETSPLRVAWGLAILAALAAGMALALYRFPQSWSVVLAGGLGLTGVLSLALARYDAAVALGFLLFAVVAIEPAPTDGVFAVVMAVAVVTGRLNLDRVPLSIGGLLGLFLLLNVLSMMEAVDGAAAGRFFGITLYLIVFSVWLVSYVQSERRARLIVTVYVVTAAVFGIASAVGLYVGFPGRAVLEAYDLTRAKGLFKDPNVFGPFLVPPILILIEEILRPRLLRWRTRTKLLMVLALSAGVLTSYSRGAWLNLLIALAAMLVILMLRPGGARNLVRLGLVLVGLTLAAFTVLEATGSLTFLQERAQRQGYDSQRFGAQNTGIRLGEEHPIGIGPGQFDVVAPVSTHSTFVRTFAEQGVLGLMTWIAIAVATLLFALRSAVLGRDSYGIGSAALLGSWVGLVSSSFFVDTLHWRHLWLVAAVIWVGTLSARSPGRGQPDVSSWSRPGRLER